MADKSQLRRWKRFFPAFGAIDAAIESALGCSRDKHRRVRGDLVEKLCDCDAAGDGGGAEALCLLLDQAMVEALQTLRLVPATPAMLTSTTDVAGAVADLRGHGSGRVRALARRVLDGSSATWPGPEPPWRRCRGSRGRTRRRPPLLPPPEMPAAAVNPRFL